MHYKHTQISYMMLVVTMVILILFVWVHITASLEPVSPDSGTNLLVTAVMVLIVLIPLLTIVRGASPIVMILLVIVSCSMSMIVTIMRRLEIRDHSLDDYYRTLKVSRRKILRTYQLPHAVPGILGALKSGLQIGTITVLVIQMQSSARGLGYLILQATYTLNYQTLLSASLATILVGAMVGSIPRLCSRFLHRYVAYRT